MGVLLQCQRKSIFATDPQKDMCEVEVGLVVLTTVEGELPVPRSKGDQDIIQGEIGRGQRAPRGVLAKDLGKEDISIGIYLTNSESHLNPVCTQ